MGATRRLLIANLPATYRYRIDADNVVVDVSDNWEEFASDNGAESCMPDDVIGAPLESFIADGETWNLFEIVIGNVRRRNRTVEFRVRCDAPDERRFCELRIAPTDGDELEFTSRILRTEERKPVRALSPGEADDEARILKICSICQRARPDEEWMEIEDALARLASTATPRLSHGLCPDCFEQVVASA